MDTARRTAPAPRAEPSARQARLRSRSRSFRAATRTDPTRQPYRSRSVRYRPGALGVAAALAAALAVALAGCGSGDPPGPAADGATPADGATTQAAPEPPPTDRELAEGDCFDLWYSGGREVRGVDCAGPHDAQLVAVLVLEAGDSMDDPATRSRYTVRCAQAVMPVQDRQPSTPALTLGVLDPDLMGPSAERTGCFLARVDQEPLTGPLS